MRLGAELRLHHQFSQPEDDGCGEGDGGEEDLRAPFVTGCNTPPVLEPADMIWMRLQLCLSCLTGIPRGLRPRMQAVIPLS